MSDHKTMGDHMGDSEHNGWVGIAQAGGFVLYAGGIAYVTMHNFNLFTNTGILPDELKVGGYATAAILMLNAIALPILIHFKFAPGGQREFAFLVYGADILAMIANAVVDSIFNRGGQLVGIEGFYFQYVVVATPILFGVVPWAIIWMLSPAQRRRNRLMRAQAAAEKVLDQRVIEHAKSNAGIDSDLDDLALEEAQAVVGAVARTRQNLNAQNSGRSNTRPRADNPAAGAVGDVRVESKGYTVYPPQADSPSFGEQVRAWLRGNGNGQGNGAASKTELDYAVPDVASPQTQSIMYMVLLDGDGKVIHYNRSDAQTESAARTGLGTYEFHVRAASAPDAIDHALGMWLAIRSRQQPQQQASSESVETAAVESPGK